MTTASDRRPVTLVTGASSGIGREIALLAAPTSRAVVLVARRRERLEELAGEITDLSGDTEAVVLPTDLTDREARRGMAEELAQRDLAVDHLVNNAGFGVAGRFDQIEPGRERAMVELDIVALHDLCVLFLPGMVERGYGRVLNVASTAAFQPLPHMATYAATKAFVLSFSEALWSEYKNRGVTVTCLCPGKTETEFFDDANMDSSAFAKAPGAAVAPVARAGWEGMMAGKRTVIPGVQNKLGAALTPLLPRGVVLSVARGLFKGD